MSEVIRRKSLVREGGQDQGTPNTDSVRPGPATPTPSQARAANRTPTRRGHGRAVQEERENSIADAAELIRLKVCNQTASTDSNQTP